MYYLLWVILIIPSLALTLICWVTNPIVCLFVRTEMRTDYVKRLNIYGTLPRIYLWCLFSGWQTHDNAVDEGWWGMYPIPFIKDKNQQDYDDSALIRYWCRVWWLSRNTAYTFSYWFFSIPLGKGFQLKGQTRSLFGYYNDYNIGWKSHKGFNRLDYAARVFGLRKEKVEG